MSKKLKEPATINTPITSGHLRRTQQRFDILQLAQTDLKKITGLHNFVFNSLSEDEKSFLLQKKSDYFRKLFNKTSTGIILGVMKEDGALIAKSIAIYPTRLKPISGMTDMTDHPRPEHSTVLQGVTVHPHYRGNYLMHHMVHAWINHAQGMSRKHLLAEVEVRNKASWSVFLDEGLEITSIGQDPDDGAILYNLQGNMADVLRKRSSVPFNPAAQGLILCAPDDIDAQKALLASGHVISGWSKAHNKMIVTPKSK